MNGFRQHIIDFEIIPTGNTKTLVFLDSSDYFREPEKPLLEVTLPGYDKYFLINIVARRLNTFNSNTLGLTELLNSDCLIDLPDGIYTFKYKICPYNETYKIKKFFRTTLLEKELEDLYTQLENPENITPDERVFEYKMVEIHTGITGAQAIVEKDERKANSYYRIAEKLIKELREGICNKNCK